MKIVCITSGPRGAGKSEYVKLLEKTHPEIEVISRDKLFLTEFGTIFFDKYTGSLEYARQILLEKIQKVVSDANKNSRIILDVWNGYSSERVAFINMLKENGADRVICLYFVTPLNTCIKWFMKKSNEERRGLNEYSCKHDFFLYHEMAENIEEDGFDAISYINPLQLTFSGFPML